MTNLLGLDFITQKYLRLYPNRRRARSWTGVTVHIPTEDGVWHIGEHGCTRSGESDSRIIPIGQAIRQIDHYGPEKQGRLLRTKTLTTEAAGGSTLPPAATDDDCSTPVPPNNHVISENSADFIRAFSGVPTQKQKPDGDP